MQTNIELMIDWVKKGISVLPVDYANLIIFNTLTGLRPTESLESLKLLKLNHNNYLNNQTMLKEHYKYPMQFIRRKNAYISIVTGQLLQFIEDQVSSLYFITSVVKEKRY